MTSLYIYYILTLIMIFCYIVVVSFLNYISIWFIFFQSIFSVVLFLSLFINLNLNSDNFCDNKSKSFILLYSMSEIFINLFFILSYVLGYITLSINILLFFNLGVIPVLFYKFLVGCLNYGYIYSSISVCLYFVLSNLWVLVILSNFHMDSVTFLFLIIWSFYLILSTSIFSWDYNGFIFNSFIFSNLLVIFWGYICGVFLFIYGVIITGLFQFNLLYFLKEETSIENIVCSSFILTLLNGSPIFFFNFLKLYIISSLINISFLGLFLFSFLSSVFLCYSLYIFFTQTKFSFITIFSSFLNGFVSILFISLLFWFFLLFFLSSFDYVTITEGSSFVTIFLNYSNILNISYFLEEGLSTDNSFLIKFFKILTFNYLTSFLLESFDFYFDIFCLSFNSATLFLNGLYFNLSVEFSVFVCIILIIVGFYFDILSFFSFENVLLLSLNQSPSVNWKEGGNIILCKLNTLLGYFNLVFPFLILIIPVYCFFVSSHNSVVLCQEDTDYGATFYVFIYGFQWGWNVTITQVSSLSELYSLTVQLLISDSGNIIGTDSHNFLDVYIKGDSKNLHIPLPSSSSINVITTSEDVNHSVGSAELGLKIDLFQDSLIIQDLCIYSDSGNEFKFDCFEYCGESHTTMWSIFTTLEEVELALSNNGFNNF